MQLEVLTCLAKAKSLEEVQEYLPQVEQIIAQAKRDLCNGHTPLEELVVIQSLSREAGSYKVPSPAAQAALQLEVTGKPTAPGQFMHFVFVRGRERVRAWELGVDARTVDVERYATLIKQAVAEITGMMMKEELHIFESLLMPKSPT